MKNEMHEMTKEELAKVNGGVWPLFLAGAALTAVGFFTAGVIDHWEEFKKGVSEGYNTFA